MAVFIVLLPYLLTTKLRCLQKNNIGHTKGNCGPNNSCETLHLDFCSASISQDILESRQNVLKAYCPNMYTMLSGFLVRRGDDTVMFYHPLFREWLIRRRDNESTKFMVDPRNGHLAIALTYSRGSANNSCNSNGNSTNSSCNSSSPPAIELNAEKILDLCHHMLKAHVYRNHQNSKSLQSTWLCQIADQVNNNAFPAKIIDPERSFCDLNLFVLEFSTI